MTVAVVDRRNCAATIRQTPRPDGPRVTDHTGWAFDPVTGWRLLACSPDNGVFVRIFRAEADRLKVPYGRRLALPPGELPRDSKTARNVAGAALRETETQNCFA